MSTATGVRVCLRMAALAPRCAPRDVFRRTLLSGRSCSSYGGSQNGWNFGPRGSNLGGNWWRERVRRSFCRPLIITSLSLPFLRKTKSDKPPLPLSHPRLPATVPIEISRCMLPDDTNPSGNVHGGTILKLIEQAGHIVSNRHCNAALYAEPELKQLPVTSVLVRVDHMDFHQPMYVGEVAQLQAAVTFTSPHSMEVTVDVWAENVLSGERRHTNTATLWYVAVPANSSALRGKPQLLVKEIPQLETLTEEGRKRYEAQKAARRSKTEEASPPSDAPLVMYHSGQVDEHTIPSSQTTLANIILPSDCTPTGHLMGGSLMKMMDNAAGICAARHCRSRVVTACIDAIDFHSPITNGEVVFVTARATFTSRKSIEIEVTTEAEGLSSSRRVTNTAYFTFVSLGKDHHAKEVPPLKVRTEEEVSKFEEGEERYLERKRARAAFLAELERQRIQENEDTKAKNQN